jgi:UDP-N-acetyl-D-glucosamine dehydrogenase
MKTNLQQKIDNKSAVVGIIGLGYVGLPLALTVCEAGYSKIIGFDVDPIKIAALNNGESYIKHIDLRRVQSAVNSNFDVTTDFSKTQEVDVLILCLPTPMTRHREPDLRFIRETLKSISPYLHRDMLISLESTTYPGTTEEEIVPVFHQNNLTAGVDSYIVYSPEREDPGNKQFPTHSIPKICGGITSQCLMHGEAFYSSIVDTVVTVSSTKTAEMTKLLENIHRAVNIGLVNEMKVVADKMDINIHEVIDAAATKPFGFTKYTPGPGLGGHCIPIDPYYLTWKAKEYNLNTRFIELSGEINRSMPEWVVSKLADALNDKGKALKGCKILLLGIAYKKNIDDARESPAVAIMEILNQKGATVAYSDPYFPSFPMMRKHQFDLQSINLDKDSLCQYDAAILTTAHDFFDYTLLAKYLPLIVDTQNQYPPGENIIPA